MMSEIPFPSKKILLPFLLFLLLFGFSPKSVSAVTSPSVLYVPLIGITSVPYPLALKNGEGDVTYNYAVKSFLQEVALHDIQVVDDKCSSVKYVEGDDNNDSILDYSETWRYSCTTKLSHSTNSVAIATGHANNMIAKHRAYATVIVGSETPPPLISIINITKVAYPLSLPAEGGKITFTYKVNNPGIVPLNDVKIKDDKCSAMSGRLGDTNGNNLLDINEVWIYTCTTVLKKTTTNTAKVSAFANGLQAIGDATITVNVDAPIARSFVRFPIVGEKPVEPAANPYVKIIVWISLSCILLVLIVVFILMKKNKGRDTEIIPDSLERNKK